MSPINTVALCRTRRKITFPPGSTGRYSNNVTSPGTRQDHLGRVHPALEIAATTSGHDWTPLTESEWTFPRISQRIPVEATMKESLPWPSMLGELIHKMDMKLYKKKFTRSVPAWWSLEDPMPCQVLRKIRRWLHSTWRVSYPSYGEAPPPKKVNSARPLLISNAGRTNPRDGHETLQEEIHQVCPSLVVTRRSNAVPGLT